MNNVNNMIIIVHVFFIIIATCMFSSRYLFLV